jgi:hypothetical protein
VVTNAAAVGAGASGDAAAAVVETDEAHLSNLKSDGDVPMKKTTTGEVVAGGKGTGTKISSPYDDGGVWVVAGY